MSNLSKDAIPKTPRSEAKALGLSSLLSAGHTANLPRSPTVVASPNLPPARADDELDFKLQEAVSLNRLTQMLLKEVYAIMKVQTQRVSQLLEELLRERECQLEMELVHMAFEVLTGETRLLMQEVERVETELTQDKEDLAVMQTSRAITPSK